jgi:hypothetical protein
VRVLTAVPPEEPPAEAAAAEEAEEEGGVALALTPPRWLAPLGLELET